MGIVEDLTDARVRKPSRTRVRRSGFLLRACRSAPFLPPAGARSPGMRMFPGPASISAPRTTRRSFSTMKNGGTRSTSARSRSRARRSPTKSSRASSKRRGTTNARSGVDVERLRAVSRVHCRSLQGVLGAVVLDAAQGASWRLLGNARSPPPEHVAQVLSAGSARRHRGVPDLRRRMKNERQPFSDGSPSATHAPVLQIKPPSAPVPSQAPLQHSVPVEPPGERAVPGGNEG